MRKKDQKNHKKANNKAKKNAKDFIYDIENNSCKEECNKIEFTENAEKCKKGQISCIITISSYFDIAQSFFLLVKEEFKKIIWPDQKTLSAIFIMVIIVSLLTSLFFNLSDYISFKIVNYIITNQFRQ